MQVCLAQAHQFELVLNMKACPGLLLLQPWKCGMGSFQTRLVSFVSLGHFLLNHDYDYRNTGIIHQVSETINPQIFFTSTTLKGVVTFD